MRALFALCIALFLAAPLRADAPPPALVDALFEAARFEGNLINLREAAIADWRETGQTVLSVGDDPAWAATSLENNDPAVIAAEFRQGFLSVPFSQAEMETAIEELQTPFGQRLTQIGLDIGALLGAADTLAADFAAAELTNGPRVVAADRVLALRGSVDSDITFLREAELAYILGLDGADLVDYAARDHLDPETQDYMAEWDRYFEDIRQDVTLSYRQMFFLVTEGFTPEEIQAWVTRAEQPWAQAFEAAFQAGFRNAWRHSMYRQGQAVAAWEDAAPPDE